MLKVRWFAGTVEASVGKVIGLIIGLAVLFGFVYLYLGGAKSIQGSEAATDVHTAPMPSAPKKTLDDMRVKSRQIENDTQKRSDETFKKAD
jgi:hypothetical protein